MSELQTNLDEVAAPAPLYDQSENTFQRHDYLESRRSGQSQPSHLGLDSEHDSPNSPGNQYATSEKESLRDRGNLHRLLQLLYVTSYLTFFSFSGTLLRIAVECLTFYPGAPLNTSVLWANVGGSILMGFLSEDQKLFAIDEDVSPSPANDVDGCESKRLAIKSHKKTIPLYIGLTTGFCGCFTSFSTFIRDVFLALVNSLPVASGPYANVSLFAEPTAVNKAPNGGFSFMAILAVLFTEIGLSLAGLFLGAHLATGLGNWTPRLPLRLIQKYLNPAVVILALLSWVATICLAILLPHYSHESSIWSAELWRGPVLFSLIFSPLGCLARFFISLKLNGIFSSFPMGTFVANLCGTMALGMAYALQHAPIDPHGVTGGSFIGCQILQGIMDGFCGCLTTVSTWVLELSDLRRHHAYFYGGVSVVVAFCALVVEMGSLKWTLGFGTPTCFAH